MGGLSRKSYSIKHSALESGLPFLLLDAGNSLFKKDHTHPVNSQDTIVAESIMKTYKKMGYSAVNVAPYDMAMGISFLKAEESFPWISSHYYENTNKPIFPTSLIKSLDGFKIGILGVSAPPAQMSKDIVYKSWHDVLPDIVEDLNKKTDFIILLSSLATVENQKIAERFSSVRLIIAASPTQSNVHPAIANNTLITQTGSGGKHLGYMTIFNAEGKKWISRNQQHLTNLQKRLEALLLQITRIEGNSATRGGHGAQNLTTLKRKTASIQKEIQKREEIQKEIEGEDTSQTSFTNKFIALHSSIPEDKSISLVLEQTKKNILSSANNDSTIGSCQQVPQIPAKMF